MSSVVHAQDEMLVDAGLGAFSTEGKSLSQVKFAKLGIQEDLWYAVKQRVNFGGWIDDRKGPFANSAFTSYQVGFDVKNALFEMSVFSGPGLISATDSSLGGHFQFNETVFIGIKDTMDESVGMAYNHFSSAGLEMPNQGKDFMCLEIKFPL
jgi:hypothetical protein